MKSFHNDNERIKRRVNSRITEKAEIAFKGYQKKKEF